MRELDLSTREPIGTTVYTLCILESAVRFDGHGYLKYLYQMEEEKQNFHLSLRIKTSDAEGTVMTANTSDWGTLQVLRLTINSKECVHHKAKREVDWEK